MTSKMGEILTDITFERWTKYIFDHPVVEGKSYWVDTDWDINDAWWDESKSPATTVAFMTQLFENAAAILAPYSDAQISQSLWYLDSDGEGYMYTLREPSVSLADRLRCINSIYILFEQVFAVRCNAYLPKVVAGTTSTAEKNPLNILCFMWWDISPLYPKMDTATPELSETVINVMQKNLRVKFSRLPSKCFTWFRALVFRFSRSNPKHHRKLV